MKNIRGTKFYRTPVKDDSELAAVQASAGEQCNILVYSYNIAPDGCAYIETRGDSEEPPEIWEERSILQVYEVYGERTEPFYISYNEAHGIESEPSPQPEPQPVDPTVSELASMIVETSVNVDYLVSLQSFQ